MQKIWACGYSEAKNCSIAFVFQIGKSEKKAGLKLAASNSYRVFINNQFIFYGPKRSAHGYSHINYLELNSWLINDNNIITVEVASYNANSFYTVDELPFFAAELNSSGELIAQSKDFIAYLLTDRITKVQRHNYQRSFIEAYQFYDRDNLYKNVINYPPVETEEVKGNYLIETDIPNCNFEKYFYKNIIESGIVTFSEIENQLSNRLYVHTSDIVKGYNYDSLSTKVSAELLKMRFEPTTSITSKHLVKNSYLLLDYGRDITGLVGIDVTVMETCSLYFIYDEIIWDEIFEIDEYKDCFEIGKAKPLTFCRTNSCNAIKWNLSPGEYNLLSFEPYTFRYGKIIIIGGDANFRNSYVRLYENSDAYRMKFKTEDLELQKIYQAAVNTYAQNSVDVLMDCPSRERGGWLCDSYFTAKAEKMFTGDNKAEKNFLKSYVLAENFSHIPKGMIPMCYPADHYDGIFIPNWAMWYSVELEDYFKRSGDYDLIMSSKNTLYGLLEYFKKFENELGLLEKLDGWVFVEWSKANDFIQDVNFPTNMLYSGMLRSIGNLYHDEILINKSLTIKNSIIENAYDGEFFQDNLVRVEGKLTKGQKTSETCQYYAFFFDIANKKSFPELYKVMFNEINMLRNAEIAYPSLYQSSSFIGNYLRLLYLMDNGESIQAIPEMKEYFLKMADRTMTLWESNNTACSCNHGFASLAANIIVCASNGFYNIDDKKRIIIVNKKFMQINSYAEIPYREGFIKITCRNGERTLILPESTKYSIEFVNSN